ncbi:MAG: FHA domain-containing protein [Planctomycetaceae bacterium]|nr:FHA domain-containing protein [Planctomycetaceae bacterium]
MLAAELKVIGGKHGGQVIPLNRRKFLIGREQDCQLRPNSEMVSRHHCVFSVDDYSVRLRDLGSTNGTFVNGERIRKETVLVAGDHVVIGNLEFELAVHAEKQITEGAAAAGSLTDTDETQVSSHTVFEMPSAGLAPVDADSTTAPAPAPAPETPAAQGAAEPTPAAPQMLTSETTMMSPAQMMPGQFPYQPQMMPQMMPQMGYPGGMYGGYPYQQMMPGFGQMYPQMMPQQMGYGAPLQAPAPTAPAAEESPKSGGQLEVKLPSPEQTGVKPPEPAPPEPPTPEGGEAAKKTPNKSTGAADAIIKQYMNRRPTTDQKN